MASPRTGPVRSNSIVPQSFNISSSIPSTVPMKKKEWKELKQLGDKFFNRIRHNSEPFANIKNLIYFKCLPADYGGPVAFISSDLTFGGTVGESIVPTIEIYGANGGSKISVINALDFHQDIVGAGWNDEENLIIVLKQAIVITYSIFGEVKRRQALSDEVKAEGIIEAKVFGSGIVCYTKKKKFYGVFDGSLHLLGKGTIDQPICWIVVEPELNVEKHLEIIVADGNNINVLGVSGTNYTPETSKMRCERMALSPSGKLLACYTRDHTVWIIQSDFSKEYLFFSTKARCLPDQFAWCGDYGIVCSWRMELNNLLLVIGLNGDYIKYQDPEPMHIMTECDGLRVISRDGCEFIYPIPAQLLRVFPYVPAHPSVATSSIGASSVGAANHLDPNDRNPAARLYQAAHLFRNEKICVQDTMDDIKSSSLPQAIDLITEAAGSEWDIAIQQELLSAAAFGISFLEKATNHIETFKETTKTLRVLNAMRSIGIPLSYIQYRVMTPDILIDRLINRRKHYFANEICKYLGLKTDKVLIRWAKKKVNDHTNREDAIARIIKNRLKDATGVSFAAIAFEAYKMERIELATLLLDAEPRAADQVPLLVHMRKYEKAIKSAIQSGDTNLVHLVLAVFRYDIDQGMGNMIDFENILRREKPARAIWTQICNETNPDYLLKMYGKEKLPMEIARIELQKAYNSDKAAEDLPAKLKMIGDLYKKSAAHLEAKLTEDELELLKVQKDLEEKLNGTFVGSSLSNTLYRLILMGAVKKAKKIRTDFKVPNKRWWWIKIKALAETGRWEALRSFANPAKQLSPIGYKPFVEVCIQNGNSAEARYYLQYLPNDEAKVIFCIQLQAWDECFQFAENLYLPDYIISQMKSKTKDARILKKIRDLEIKQSDSPDNTPQ